MACAAQRAAASVNEKEKIMKLAIFVAVALLAGISSQNAQAWAFIVVDGSGHAKTVAAPPWDLTYPPDNTPVRIVDGAGHAPPQGALLTPEREARRLNANMLIIANVPAR
jgi:hypothetical protein